MLTTPGADSNRRQTVPTGPFAAVGNRPGTTAQAPGGFIITSVSHSARLLARAGILYPSRGRENALPNRTPESLWETALGQLELQVTRPNFETWLRHTVGLHLAGGHLTVGVTSDFAIEWLRSRMAAPINRTVSQLRDNPTAVTFQVLGAPPIAQQPSTNGSRPTPIPPPPDLDVRLTFDSFTVVKANRLAYRAALRLARGESAYNPLIFYGTPGLGKTHLLHAIAHQAVSAGKRVALLTAEAFVDRYSRAVESHKRHSFRDAFADIDLLLLDDAQFLAGRPGSQDQFFHIFNTLLSSGRSIALTVDAAPDTIADLSPRLRSRLGSGLSIELRLPPKNECFAILRNKASQLDRPPQDTALRQILKRPFSHIRALEGSLNRLDAYIELTGTPPHPDSFDEALHPLQSQERPTAEIILNLVSEHLHVSREHLAGPSRARDVTYARHIAMYLLRSISQRSLSDIGRLLGNRDHSTVLSGSRRIKQELATLPDTQAHIQALEAALHNITAA